MPKLWNFGCQSRGTRSTSCRLTRGSGTAFSVHTGRYVNSRRSKLTKMQSGTMGKRNLGARLRSPSCRSLMGDGRGALRHFRQRFACETFLDKTCQKIRKRPDILAIFRLLCRATLRVLCRPSWQPVETLAGHLFIWQDPCWVSLWPNLWETRVLEPLENPFVRLTKAQSGTLRNRNL